MPRRPRQKRVRFRRLTRRARYRLLAPTLEILRRIIAFLPHRAALALGWCIGAIFSLFAFKLHRLALDHLETAGIGASPAERKTIVRRMFRSISMAAIESLNASNWSASQCLARVSFSHPDILREQQALGRGMILMAGHIGNWELVPFATGATFNHPLTVVMASSSDTRLTEWIMRLRSRLGYTIITTDEGALPLMRRLRRGELIGILADQDTTRARGIFVDFFGRPAYTPIGPAMLQLRAKCPMIPLAIRRDPLNATRHIIRVGTPILPDPAAPEDDEIRRLTQEYTRQIESFIRETPDHWVWFHERWRHQPNKKIRLRQPKK